jgi:hypothetical protein
VNIKVKVVLIKEEGDITCVFTFDFLTSLPVRYA